MGVDGRLRVRVKLRVTVRLRVRVIRVIRPDFLGVVPPTGSGSQRILMQGTHVLYWMG